MWEDKVIVISKVTGVAVGIPPVTSGRWWVVILEILLLLHTLCTVWKTAGVVVGWDTYNDVLVYYSSILLYHIFSVSGI